MFFVENILSKKKKGTKYNARVFSWGKNFHLELRVIHLLEFKVYETMSILALFFFFFFFLFCKKKKKEEKKIKTM
jgi:hypothetical protein